MVRRGCWFWVTLFVGFVAPVFGQDLPVFTDVTEQAGIDFHHRFGDDKLDNIVESTGAGAMFFDYNNDGWLDIYFCNGAWSPDVNDNMGRHYRGKLTNRLYENNRDGTFTDVTQRAGVGDTGASYGCSAADFDGDGDLDLYVCNYGRNVFYRNNGNGTFTDISEASGLDDKAWSLNAIWFDYDGDGDLDVFVVNYLQYDGGKFRSYYPAQNFPGPLSYAGQPDTLYRNNGDGTFTDVTREAGVYDSDGRGMSGTVSDLDNDGLLDIYVANDATANHYFRNLGNGRFENDALPRGLAFGEGGQGVSSMGPTVGDVDRNGWFDLYIPDMGYGCLLMNQEGYFDDRTAPSTLAVISGQYTGWGGVMFDFDNNGHLDLFVANGHPHFEYPEEDLLLRNDGNGNFSNVSEQCGEYFHREHVGRGAACADFDNDGDMDLLVVNLNDKPVLLRNDGGNRQHWLQVDARLPGGRSSAVGARVTVHAQGAIQIREAIPVVGYLSQSDIRLHFGLGTATRAEKIEIRWPDGQQSVLEDVPANQLLTVIQDAN